MARTLRHTLLSIRDLIASAGPFAVLAVALLVLAYLWLDPNPPRRLTLATGPAQSAYDQFGQRYREALAVEGIEVVLVPTAGSSANLQLLQKGHVDFGFVQGGSSAGTPAQASGILSLGSLFVEPVWLFYREEAATRHRVPAGASPGAHGTRTPQAPVAPGKLEPDASRSLRGLTDLKGLRLNVGTPGSGVPQLMDKLFEANRIEAGAFSISQLEQTPATVSFLEGKLDALVFASAPESLMVQMLLQTPGVKLLDFAQSEAYSRRFPFLTPVVLPRGVVDLARDLPPQDVRLVATTTSLLTRENTHPALVQLLAQQARDLHGPAGWFNRTGSFPSIEHSEYPVSREAERAIRGGPTFLQGYLKFWMANFIERMWLVLGILIAVLLPLSRIVPPLYEFRVRSRVFRWYAQLRDIENRMQEQAPPPREELVRELDDLEEKAGGISVPLAYADELYALRNNINLVRRRLVQSA